MLSKFFDHVINIQRRTATQDASGGMNTGTWADVAGLTGIKCAIYDQGGAQDVLGIAGARRDWVSEYVFVTDKVYAINPGDRIYSVTNGIYYDITSTKDHSNAGVSRETVFSIFCNLRRVTSGVQ